MFPVKLRLPYVWDSPPRSRSRPASREASRTAGSLLLCVAILASAFLGCARSEKAPEFTGQAAWRYLKKQCSLGARPPGTAAHDKTIRLIADHLKSRGAEVTLQRFTRGDPYADRSLVFTNVIGSFSPDRKKRVLLGAHFDTRPWADREETDSLRSVPIVGANDGASGVAVLMEIADLIGAVMPKDIGVDLVFFDGEDYGKEGDLEHYLIGSKYFAANLGGYRPEFAIILDMIGAADAQIQKEENSLVGAPDITDEIFRRAESLGLGIFVSQRGGAIYDDHIPLLLAGIPAVDLISFPYAYWHTLGDTPDKCSKKSLREVGILVADVLYNFSF